MQINGTPALTQIVLGDSNRFTLSVRLSRTEVIAAGGRLVIVLQDTVSGKMVLDLLSQDMVSTAIFTLTEIVNDDDEFGVVVPHRLSAGQLTSRHLRASERWGVIARLGTCARSR